MHAVLLRSVALFSGGKDSFMAATLANEQGMEIEELITVLPEKDSFMYHYPNAVLAMYPASILGLKWVSLEERAIAGYLAEKAGKGVECVISGAVESEYQKTRIERMCAENGMLSYNPLWRKSHDLILEEINRRGIRAIIVSVSAEGLGIELLGRELDRTMVEYLHSVNLKHGISLIGEGGEYETFVTGCAGSKKSVRVMESHNVVNGLAGFLFLDRLEVV